MRSACAMDRVCVCGEEVMDRWHGINRYSVSDPSAHPCFYSFALRESEKRAESEGSGKREGSRSEGDGYEDVVGMTEREMIRRRREGIENHASSSPLMKEAIPKRPLILQERVMDVVVGSADRSSRARYKRALVSAPSNVLNSLPFILCSPIPPA